MSTSILLSGKYKNGKTIQCGIHSCISNPARHNTVDFGIVEDLFCKFENIIRFKKIKNSTFIIYIALCNDEQKYIDLKIEQNISILFECRFLSRSVLIDGILNMINNTSKKDEVLK